MTSSLLKKRPTTRPSIHRLMTGSSTSLLRLQLVICCAMFVGVPELAFGLDKPPKQSPVKLLPSRTITKKMVIRAQSQSEAEAADSEPNDRTSNESQSESADDPALQRLKQRSARQRWEKLHQEWLKLRKEKQTPKQPDFDVAPLNTNVDSDDVARSNSVREEDTSDESNPFEEPTEKTTAPKQAVAPPPDQDFSAFEDGAPELSPNPTPSAENNSSPSPRVTGPRTRTTELVSPGDDGNDQPTGRVHLQSQQKDPGKKPLTAEEQLKQLLEGESIIPIPAPITDPAQLPKITDINPNPKPRDGTAGGRPIPEQDPDPKRYVRLGDIPYVQRISPEMLYTWEPTNSYYYPLYFEDPELERYGHKRRPVTQLACSLGLFGVQLAAFPYQMVIAPPSKPVYPLGYYSPGDYVPYRLRQVPLSWKAAGAEAATVLGLRFALP